MDSPAWVLDMALQSVGVGKETLKSSFTDTRVAIPSPPKMKCKKYFGCQLQVQSIVQGRAQVLGTETSQTELQLHFNFLPFSQADVSAQTKFLAILTYVALSQIRCLLVLPLFPQVVWYINPWYTRERGGNTSHNEMLTYYI